MSITMWRFCPLFVLAALCAGAAEADRGGVRVRWVTGGVTRVEAAGLDPAALERLDAAKGQALMPVYAGGAGAARAPDVQPMAGTYRVEDGVLVFEPQFPPEPGVTYRAVLRAGGESVAAEYTAPARAASEPTTVTQVYPTARRLPENLLKFYVHFSAPMRRGGIYDHIKLLDDAGKEVELPFLEIDEELWDPEMKRLTLFIDPGRIKRGVTPLEEIGPALVAGKHFRLIIAPTWRDAAGTPLGKGFDKAFEVVAPDRDPPDPAAWEVSPPAAGTRDPLVVTFDEPMDHALALRLMSVVGPEGKGVRGVAALAAGERRWTFTPAAPWARGKHAVAVWTTVEDLAGNNIGKPFEVDLSEGTRAGRPPETVNVPFTIR